MATLFDRIPCPKYDHINEEIMAWLNNQDLLSQSTEFWNQINVLNLLRSCPGFTDWLQTSGLKIKTLAVTIGRRLDCCGPHIDTPPARYKLSCPVMNTKNTYNRWFVARTENPKVTINKLGGMVYSDYDELQEIQRIEVTRPMLIDAGQIHDVYIVPGSPLPRIGLQGQMFNEPANL